ncbi:MAG: hypothetical protein HYZ54_14855 [Ignavibacteriae bacterium]|nr:hypothetical protein [Ignavibacteriota bacterium]
MKKIIFILVICLYISNVYAQETFVYAAPKGIYITNVVGAASDNMSLPDGTVKVSIQRKQANESNWKEIGSFKQPESLEELQKRFNQFSGYSPDLYFINTANIDRVWSRFENAKYTFDSCYNYIHEPAMGLAMGYLFLDSTVQAGTYEYQLVKYTKSGTKQVFATTSSTTWPEVQKMNKPRMTFSKGRSERAELIYTAIGGKKPVYFKVFRQFTYFNKFEQIWPEFNIKRGRNDSIYMTIFDQQVVADNDYRYFIVPVDAFGNKGMASDTVTLFTTDKKDIVLPEYIHTSQLNSGIKLSWKLNQKGNLSFVEVYRGTEYDGSYKLIGRASPTDTSFKDQDVLPMITYYYYLRVLDKSGREGFNSARVYGLYSTGYAPLPPVITGVVAEREGIKITWIKTDQNIKGYYVYRGVGQFSEEMKQITGLIETNDSVVTYIDTTSRMPSQGYSYAVSQENTSHREGLKSRPMFINKLLNTSQIVPVPVFHVSKVGKNALLSWQMINGLQGITSFKIIRKTQGNTVDQININLPAAISVYNDTTTRKGNVYIYEIQAVDMTGNLSEPSQLTLDLSIEAPMPVDNFTASATEEGTVVLRWTLSTEDQVQGYKIYRFDRGSDNVVLLGTAVTSENIYIDRTTEKDKTYGYFVRCIYDGNKENEPSHRIYMKR